ncbi:hypothetical protein ACFL2D_00755 [Patescibacteria group bacterium]
MSNLVKLEKHEIAGPEILSEMDVRHYPGQRIIPPVQVFSMKLSPSMDIDTMLQRGDFYWWNSNLCATNFPFRADREVEQTMALVSTSLLGGAAEGILFPQALAGKPANFFHLLAMRFAPIDVSAHHLTLALGSPWHPKDGSEPCFPVMFRMEKNIGLNLQYTYHGVQNCSILIACEGTVAETIQRVKEIRMLRSVSYLAG